MLGGEFNVHVRYAVLLEKIIQHVFRGGSLPCGEHGFTGEVGKALNACVPAHNVQHAERVHGKDLHLSLGFGVQHRRHVGGQRGDIQLAADERRLQRVRRAGKRYVIAVAGFTLFVFIQQQSGAHTGGALEQAEVHVRLFGGFGGNGRRGGVGRRGRLCFAAGAQQQREREQYGNKGGDFFHVRFLLCFYFEFIICFFAALSSGGATDKLK